MIGLVFTGKCKNCGCADLHLEYAVHRLNILRRSVNKLDVVVSVLAADLIHATCDDHM